jgi:hypothetical protein
VVFPGFNWVETVYYRLPTSMFHNFINQTDSCTWCGDKKNLDADRDCPRTEATGNDYHDDIILIGTFILSSHIFYINVTASFRFDPAQGFQAPALTGKYQFLSNCAFRSSY